MPTRARCAHVVLATVAIVLLSPAPVAAQDRGVWEVGAQVMGSPVPSRPDFFFGGQAAGIRQTALSLLASTDLLHVGPMHLRYSAQLLPAMLLTGAERYQKLDSDGRTIYVVGGTTRAIGIGFVPLGLALSADLGRRVRAQVGTAAGIMRFSRNIPVAGARQRNFSAELDAALMLNAGHDRWVQLGMRWKHISNGFTAYENPGIDNRMIFAGFSTILRTSH